MKRNHLTSNSFEFTKRVLRKIPNMKIRYITMYFDTLRLKASFFGYHALVVPKHGMVYFYDEFVDEDKTVRRKFWNATSIRSIITGTMGLG